MIKICWLIVFLAFLLLPIITYASMFDTENPDALTGSPDMAALPPRAGFYESFRIGYRWKILSDSQYSIEIPMWRFDEGQSQLLKQAGEALPPRLSPKASNPLSKLHFKRYLAVAKFYNYGGSPEFGAVLESYNEKIESLSQKYSPLQLKTSDQIWFEIKHNAQEAETTQRSTRHTLSGSIGNFLGILCGTINPEFNPFFFLLALIFLGSFHFATRWIVKKFRMRKFDASSGSFR